MSGILSVILFAVAAAGEPYSWSVPIRLSFFVLAVVAVYGSAYSVWKKERERVNRLRREVDELKKQLDDIRQSRFERETSDAKPPPNIDGGTWP